MNLKARTKSFHVCIDELQSIRNGVLEGKGKERNSKEQDTGKRLLLGGRSMGARAAVIAASEHLAERDEEGGEMDVRLVLVSYPLQGPKDELRDQVLLDIPEGVGVLFVIGDRDAMCPLDLLHETRSKMSAQSQLVVIRGADHGMHTKPASLTKGLGEETGRVAARWVHGEVEEDITYIGEEEKE
jgi:predicted alpha/beta-hydrolase family hydrolase